VALRGRGADVEQKLRAAPEAIVARIADDRVLLDLRSLMPDRDQDLADAVIRAFAG
jgi:seryl-tRNA(Sec) selenium transferase